MTTATDPSSTARTAVEKAAACRRSLYVPSVLGQAAELLTALWAAGGRHGVEPEEWYRKVDLASGALDVIAERYTRAPHRERAGDQVAALCQELVTALSTEIGLTVRPGPRRGIAIVQRPRQTPRGGSHGDADLLVGIYSRSGWDISVNADGAAVVPIAAPATTAGAAETAAVVGAVARGELGNPFRL